MKLYDNVAFWVIMFIFIIILLLADLTWIQYQSTQLMNDAKAEVFSNITNTTTNKEIVNNIHEVCSNMPWWYPQTDCESYLLKTFITPTK